MTTSACWPRSRKYSAIVMPANGAIHCNPAAACATATTKMQRSGAPCSRTASIDPPTADGLLADRDIDADQVGPALIDDRIDRDRGLAGGAIADDQFALAAAEREQRIDGEDAGLHRLGDQFALDDRRRRPPRSGFCVVGRRAAVRRRAARPSGSTTRPSRLADRRLDHLAGAAHPVARLNRRPHRQAGRSRYDLRVERVREARSAPPSKRSDFVEAGVFGRPETWAMPSPIRSTRPNFGDRAPAWSGRSRLRRRFKPVDVICHEPVATPSPIRSRSARQLLCTLACGVTQFEPGDQRWVDLDETSVGRSAERLRNHLLAVASSSSGSSGARP